MTGKVGPKSKVEANDMTPANVTETEMAIAERLSNLLRARPRASLDQAHWAADLNTQDIIGSSIEVLRFIMRVEEEFNVEFEDELLLNSQLQTLGDWLALVRKSLDQANSK